MLGAFPRDHLEVLVKAGEIGEPAFKAQLFDADTIVYKQLAGMPHPYLRKELRICLPGAGFEITAKGVGDQPCYRGYLIQIDLLGEMTEGIIVDRIDPVAFHFGEVVPETDG